jgi:hypothetical protein
MLNLTIVQHTPALLDPNRPKETPLFFFEFSLCLSRACLGKMMHFMYKWHRKKWRFFTGLSA